MRRPKGQIRRRLVISQNPRFTICGESEDARKAIAAVRSLRPEFVVLDISMPGISGIELVKMIMAEERHTRILMLSMHDESHYALRALKAGAKGDLMKSEVSDTVIDALMAVSQGKIYVSPVFTERLIFPAVKAGGDGAGSVSVLSDRELEVLEKVGKGLSTREVAADLQLLSPPTSERIRHILIRRAPSGPNS